MPKTTEAFSLDTERDADILDWLESQDNKSAAIRAAIRASWLSSSITLADILNEIGEVKRMLRAGVSLDNSNGQDEPQKLTPSQREAQEALDSLGI
jgi:hypothetical protein